ncbi:MAG: isochorismate synthase [Sporichthyaceae bacterium]|nr:isochorismate synthase [Sporichthyaceae bacterium]
MGTAPGESDLPGQRPAALPSRTVRSRRVDLIGPLLHRLPSARGALAWVREGDGVVGWGEAARLEVSGPHRFARARAWWRQVLDSLSVEDEVSVRGSGPLLFGSFSFSADETSVLVLPRVALGRSGGTSWLTTIGEPPRLSSPEPVREPGGMRYAHGQMPVTAFRSAVERAVALIDRGELEKVVLAHDLVAWAEETIDPRFVLAGLAAANPGCWAFAVDGLVGATPELLVSLAGTRVTSRVLAGTTARGGSDADDVIRVDALLHSAKDLAEHRYAVDSLVAALTAHVRELSVPARPRALELSNVTHLATDVSASLTARSEADVLDLVAALHPTAAVGGTPTDVALDVVARLEQMDRGRYTGPVGWMDARGDGEWGVALRCAQLSGRAARLFAGCGIVAGSEPDAEVLEAQAKFVPVRDALEGSAAR